jgi:hypothetical protein
MTDVQNFVEELIRIEYPECWPAILRTEIIDYLTKKTQSVYKGSKARGSFANLYAIYVLVEDYINNGFLNDPQGYAQYEGMRFADAFERQRQLPFGEKLQNHALNHRCNQEFLKYYPHLQAGPIRRIETGRYWINDDLLFIECDGQQISLAPIIIKIIDRYVELKREGFETFFETMQALAREGDPSALASFIREQLEPQVDARIFEIVSFALTKFHFSRDSVYFGQEPEKIRKVPLQVFRTGRTNANDGGIDFIMQPLGRIFQVTEVLDLRKYFLDIGKLNRYPITFIVKRDNTPENIMGEIVSLAPSYYPDPDVRESYLEAIEEIMTIPTLVSYLGELIEVGLLEGVAEEIITQCKVEFNITE